MVDTLKGKRRPPTEVEVGIAAIFPKISNRNKGLNKLQEANFELRADGQFILLEEWEITDASEYSIKNKLITALDRNPHLLKFFSDRLESDFPLDDDKQPRS